MEINGEIVDLLELEVQALRKEQTALFNAANSDTPPPAPAPAPAPPSAAKQEPRAPDWLEGWKIDYNLVVRKEDEDSDHEEGDVADEREDEEGKTWEDREKWDEDEDNEDEWNEKEVQMDDDDDDDRCHSICACV